MRRTTSDQESPDIGPFDEEHTMISPQAILLSAYMRAETEERRRRIAGSYGRPGPRRRLPALPGLRLPRRPRRLAALS